jgi:hypothetical protein
MRPLTIPFFVCGVGSVLEMYPVPMAYHVERPSATMTDAQRLASDWQRVGRALSAAMTTARAESTSGKERIPGQR